MKPQLFKIPNPKEKEQEYGPGKKDFVVCSDCNAVYYHKSWHHGFTDYKHLTENKAVNFIVCPACQMIKDGKFEGKVVFENVPEELRDEVMRNAENTGKKEFERDPMDRIIRIKNPARGEARQRRQESRIEVLTTENQLARNIARQVERAYKGCKSEVIWSKEESAAVIIVRFL